MPALPASPPSPDLVSLRDTLTARLAPADAVEEHWVGEIAFALWQQQRLQALAALALAAAEADTDEPDGTSRLPSLATLARYRARIERDLKLARQELEAARQSRPRHHAPANDTDEPELRPREPEPPVTTASRPLNRHDRRRLEALLRRGASPPPRAINQG